ncbi:urease accessory protein UreF [Massilia sp. PWRC2]|uniref:urease accessory protein UreF n=1 Tax=Massilia sp. PWRC2 TaxID=2804626 RepID=UPI003CFB500A
MNAAALLHLLQFASPALPIGGYSYSQGLETAIERGLVVDAASARAWIAAYLALVMARWDGPLLWRLMRAFAAGDMATVALWSERFIASRDCAELRAETIQMGYSLTRLLDELALGAVARLGAEVSLPTAFACAVDALAIDHGDALVASLFAWAENQVLVCVKSVPLGQVAGQRLLLSLAPDIEAAAAVARSLADEEMSNWAPGLSILSMQHEVQHGRLYRS